MRGRVTADLFDPVVAFGPGAAHQSLASWSGFSMFTPGKKYSPDTATPTGVSKAPPEQKPLDEKKVVEEVVVVTKELPVEKNKIGEEKPVSLLNSLSTIELDEDSIGKK